MRVRRFATAVLLACSVLLAPSLRSEQTFEPLRVGTDANYVLKYFGLPGGDVSIRTLPPPESVPGAVTYRADLKTNFAISTVWRIEDTFIALVDPAARRTLSTRFFENENGKSRYRRERFTAHGVRIEEKRGAQTKKRTQKLGGPTLDPVGGILMLGARPLSAGTQTTFQLFANNKVFKVQATAQKAESRRIGGRELQVYPVRTALTHKGKPVNDVAVTAYFTADAAQALVLLEAKLSYGAVTLERAW